METNLYQTPESEVLTKSLIGGGFYIVSPKKFLVLFFATMGLYGIYWFYKHWAQNKLADHSDTWPVMRGIFSIFFTHSLFELIDLKLREKQLEYSWSPSVLATIYVVLSIVERVADRVSGLQSMSETLWIDFVAFVTLPIIGWCLYKAQLAANIAMEDSQGDSNKDFTPLNFLWILIGVLLWAVIVFSIYVIAGGEADFLL